MRRHPNCEASKNNKNNRNNRSPLSEKRRRGNSRWADLSLPFSMQMVNNAINIKPRNEKLLYCTTTSNYKIYRTKAHTKRKYFVRKFSAALRLVSNILATCATPPLSCCGAHIFPPLANFTSSCSLPGGGHSHVPLISCNFMTSFRLGDGNSDRLGL